jgi:uncharacterized protein (TIGR01244 family)
VAVGFALAGAFGMSQLKSAPMVRLLAILALAGTICAAGKADDRKVPVSVSSELIPNYRAVRPGLATGGQPTAAGLRQLQELGFRTVVNLMSEAEDTRAEQDAVRTVGLRYVSVPITPDRFRREDAETVAKVIEDIDAQPVLLHCSSGNRVGGVWTVLQVIKGEPYEKAEAEGRQIGLRSPAMLDAVKRVLGLDSKQP